MEWAQPTYKQFVLDMALVSIPVIEHRGRKFYHGPAVVADNVVDVIKKTTVSCTWDEHGSGWIIHPFPEKA